ncbi:MAG: desulfoferrodoxin family protein [Clostridia bacterium]|nr:desulfoferrodoxin family protein [Clostridia bacterium]
MAKARQNFYICEICGNIVGLINDAGIPLVCCGEEMKELIPNGVEAKTDYHIPSVSIAGNLVNVKIGSLPHPMTEQHHISWVYLQTEKGGQRKILKPGQEPVLNFALTEDDSPEIAYAYCTLHGLWKSDIK